MDEPPILKHTLSYIAGSIFLIAIAIYIYLMIEDNKQKTKHSTEETTWIYLLLVILIVGFISSYYFIRKSNTRVFETMRKGRIQFVGKNPRIPTRGGLGPLRNAFRN